MQNLISPMNTTRCHVPARRRMKKRTQPGGLIATCFRVAEAPAEPAAPDDTQSNQIRPNAISLVSAHLKKLLVANWRFFSAKWCCRPVLLELLSSIKPITDFESRRVIFRSGIPVRITCRPVKEREQSVFR
jgi:hypothetical protein